MFLYAKRMTKMKKRPNNKVMRKGCHDVGFVDIPELKQKNFNFKFASYQTTRTKTTTSAIKRRKKIIVCLQHAKRVKVKPKNIYAKGL